MRLEWIEDLIAVAEAPTLTAAAVRRNVTQPAFTRRLRTIEDHMGFELIDRRHKPARPTPVLRARLKELRYLASQMRQISAEMAATAQGGSLLQIVSQHALSLKVLSQIAPGLRRSMPEVILRVHAADHDECFSMLMTGGAAMMFTYEVPGSLAGDSEALVERHRVLREPLVPVVQSDSEAESAVRSGGTVPLISYPQETFLGITIERSLELSKSKEFKLESVCETALTPAVLELALAGMGIAWVPKLMAAPHLEAGSLRDLSEVFGRCYLDAVMLRLRTHRPRIEDQAWKAIQREAENISC